MALGPTLSDPFPRKNRYNLRDRPDSDDWRLPTLPPLPPRRKIHHPALPSRRSSDEAQDSLLSEHHQNHTHNSNHSQSNTYAIEERHEQAPPNPELSPLGGHQRSSRDYHELTFISSSESQHRLQPLTSLPSPPLHPLGILEPESQVFVEFDLSPAKRIYRRISLCYHKIKIPLRMINMLLKLTLIVLGIYGFHLQRIESAKKR